MTDLVAFHNTKADTMQAALEAFSPNLGQFIDCEGNRVVTEYERDVTMWAKAHRVLAQRAAERNTPNDHR